METWPIIGELAAQQYGRLSARQAEAAGLDRTVLARMAARQHWARPYRGVYATLGASRDAPGRLAEALLAVGPPVLVARWSAAWLWGLVRTPPTVPELVIPHARRAGRLPGMDVRRSRTLVPGDGAVVRGLPITSMARTLSDLAACTDASTLRGLLIDARQRRQADLADVAAAAGRMGTAKGLRQLRVLLRELDGAHCDSVFEYRMRLKLRETSALPAPEPAPFPVTTPYGVLHVDIAWPAWRVGLELDGFGSHAERKSLEVDARRHNALQLVRWRVLRATWADLGPQGDALLAQLRALLA